MKKTVQLFDAWNEQKKRIEFGNWKSIDARVGEFWWYWEGVNVGNEISKDGFFLRTCLVLQNDLGNGLLLVVPITTKYHARMKKWYIKVDHFEKYWLKECWLVMNQVKLIDKKRLANKTWNYIPHRRLVELAINKYISLIKKSPRTRSTRQR